MTSGGAVNISQEQLQQVAERLGERHLKCTHDGEWESHYPEGNGWQTRWRSDGDLLLSILNRAAEIDGIANFFLGYDTEKKQWQAGYIRPFMSFHDHFEGVTPLEAAILAFIQLPIPASQGDA